MITGVNPPGRVFCRPDGSAVENVHVGLQIGRDPAQLVRADQSETPWEVDIEIVRKGGVLDFRGPAVQGKRGDRFIYLTWGNVSAADEFEMFRRAKLMLDRVEPGVIESAVKTGCLAARVDLTGNDGGPRCARVDPPAVAWSAPGA
jgi:hypothetical protein